MAWSIRTYLRIRAIVGVVFEAIELVNEDAMNYGVKGKEEDEPTSRLHFLPLLRFACAAIPSARSVLVLESSGNRPYSGPNENLSLEQKTQKLLLRGM